MCYKELESALKALNFGFTTIYLAFRINGLWKCRVKVMTLNKKLPQRDSDS